MPAPSTSTLRCTEVRAAAAAAVAGGGGALSGAPRGDRQRGVPHQPGDARPHARGAAPPLARHWRAGQRAAARPVHAGLLRRDAHGTSGPSASRAARTRGSAASPSATASRCARWWSRTSAPPSPPSSTTLSWASPTRASSSRPPSASRRRARARERGGRGGREGRDRWAAMRRAGRARERETPRQPHARAQPSTLPSRRGSSSSGHRGASVRSSLQRVPPQREVRPLLLRPLRQLLGLVPRQLQPNRVRLLRAQVVGQVLLALVVLAQLGALLRRTTVFTRAMALRTDLILASLDAVPPVTCATRRLASSFFSTSSRSSSSVRDCVRSSCVFTFDVDDCARHRQARPSAIPSTTRPLPSTPSAAALAMLARACRVPWCPPPFVLAAASFEPSRALRAPA